MVTIHSLDVLLSQFGTSLLFHFRFCCFLTCIQISQEAVKVVWYSYLLKNFPDCCDSHSQRLWHSQWGRSRYFSGSLLLFLWSNRCWQFDLWFLLHFLNPAWTSGSSHFMYCWSLAWRILSITLVACEMSAIVVVWTFFGIAFLWDWNESWPFPVLWPLLSFPNLLAYWVQHFNSIIF